MSSVRMYIIMLRVYTHTNTFCLLLSPCNESNYKHAFSSRDAQISKLAHARRLFNECVLLHNWYWLLASSQLPLNVHKCMHGSANYRDKSAPIGLHVKHGRHVSLPCSKYHLARAFRNLTSRLHLRPPCTIYHWRIRSGAFRAEHDKPIFWASQAYSPHAN